MAKISKISLMSFLIKKIRPKEGDLSPSATPTSTKLLKSVCCPDVGSHKKF